MNEVEQKAHAFDKIYAELKASRKRTNIDAWREVLDKVIRKFDWELILIGNHHVCKTCGKRLPMPVINWCYGKEVQWFCEEHYQIEKAKGNHVLTALDRSFRYMIARNKERMNGCQY